MSNEKRSVLVVEDDESVQSMLYDDLHDEYEVMQAYDGEEGLAKLLERTPDIILLDLKMSPMDGYTFIDEVEQRCLPDVPILILTAFGDVQLRAVDLLKHNERVKNLLAKPIRYMSYLHDSIEQVIGTPTSQPITDNPT